MIILCKVCACLCLFLSFNFAFAMWACVIEGMDRLDPWFIKPACLLIGGILGFTFYRLYRWLWNR